MKLSNEDVLRFIPHRDPFLFIDTVESITIPEEIRETPKSELKVKDLLGSQVVANFHCREDLDLFRGHFPGNPVLPGVVQVEMMAQASMFILCEFFENPFEQKLEVALLNVQNSKFRKPVLPGSDLKIEATCTKIRGPIMSYDARILLNGEVVSEASLLASVRY